MNDSHCKWVRHFIYNPITENEDELLIFNQEAFNAVRAYYNTISATKLDRKFFEHFVKSCVYSHEWISENDNWIETWWIDMMTNKVLAKFVNITTDKKSPLALMLAPLPK
jgi:hypothetical protein